MAFKRGPQKRNVADAVGRVTVTITLRDRAPGGYAVVKGNITRTITVHDARVSDVAACVEDALFARA